MAAYLETPSRVWRRIQADQDRDMPSLPSIPAFDDSASPQFSMDDSSHDSSQEDMQIASPIQSTPNVLSHMASTVRAPSSTSSAARFAQSIASRSSKSSISISRGMSARYRQEPSFDISAIPSVPLPDASGEMEIRSSDQDSENSVPEVYLPPGDEEPDLDLSEALQSVSRSNSPGLDGGPTPRKKSDYDFSMSLRSEPQVGWHVRVSWTEELKPSQAISLRQDATCLASSTCFSYKDTFSYADHILPIVVRIELYPAQLALVPMPTHRIRPSPRRSDSSATPICDSLPGYFLSCRRARPHSNEPELRIPERCRRVGGRHRAAT
ncbi:hypothetical protein C8Q80DRAFT_243410 [Daedaleopsis nitida]|nr:hypothetical protein C8Q80DRAFT_243410 [Daedaleopsis nitida]